MLSAAKDTGGKVVSKHSPEACLFVKHVASRNLSVSPEMCYIARHKDKNKHMENSLTPTPSSSNEPQSPSPQASPQQPTPSSAPPNSEQTPVPAQPPSAVPAVPQPLVSEAPAPKKSHRALRIFLGVLAVIIILAIIAAIGFIKGSNEVKGAQTVGDSFIQDMANGDATAAYRLTGSSFQKNISENSFTSLTATVHQNLSERPTRQGSWNVTKASGQPETATLSYTATGPGNSGQIHMSLQKVNGQWQVSYVNFPTFAVQGYTISR